MGFRRAREFSLLCLAGLALIGGASPASAQASLPAGEFRIELAAGAGSDRFTGALSATHHLAVAFDRRLRLGYGLRYSFFGGNDLRFRTADRDELNGNPTDHAVIHQSRIHAVNLAAHLGFRVAQRVELGFNIDVIGVGFGPDQELDQETAGPVLTGSPAGFNLLRGGVRDRGTLDSEFYAGWQVTRRVLLRAGLSHHVAEYRAASPLAGGSTRIRVDGNLWFAALGYRF